jgi:Kef-type K+ transport system membrane component KefB
MNFLPHWPLEFTPHIAFGIMLIVGSLGGYMAHRIPWIPSITGFMLVGFLAGPSGLGLISHDMIQEARILIDIALALILYRLGLSLDLKLLLKTPAILLASLLECFATFGAVFYLLTLFHTPTALAILIAAITISSSPAVLLHVAKEVNAKGVATETAKTLVALNNLISFVVFSAALPMVLFSSGFQWTTVLFQPLYTLVGSTLLGVFLAFFLHAIATKTHSATQYKFALIIGTLMLSIGLASDLKLSMLFVALVLGVTIKSIEKEKTVSHIEFGASFELFFIVLFVFAGAGLHIQEIVTYAPIILLIVLARSLAKVFGVTLLSSIFRKPMRTGLASGMLLIPMAGLAIGLTLTTDALIPEQAGIVSAIVLGAVAIFETMGPPIAIFAFRFAKEANESDIKHDSQESDEANTADDALTLENASTELSASPSEQAVEAGVMHTSPIDELLIASASAATAAESKLSIFKKIVNALSSLIKRLLGIKSFFSK